jgi:predicted RNA-binding protein with PIN domain
VRFSKPPATADDLIREIVEDLARARIETTVVTADLEVARHARAHGAQVVLSDLFAASLFPERVREQVAGYKKERGEAEGADKPLGFSRRELEEWAKLFGAAREEEEK